MIAPYDPQALSLGQAPSLPDVGGGPAAAYGGARTPYGNANPTLQPARLPSAPAVAAAQRRAQLLADALEASSEDGQKIRGGIGEVGLRLLAQALLAHDSRKAQARAAALRDARAAPGAQSLPTTPTPGLNAPGYLET